MGFRYGLLLLIVFLSLTPAVQSASADTKKVVFGAVEFPPHFYYDPKEKACKGELTEPVIDAFSESEFQVEVICMSAARLYGLLGSGKVDLTVNIKNTASIVGKVDFVSKPFTQLKLNLYQQKQKHGDRTIAAIRGYSYNDFRAKLEAENYVFYDLVDGPSAINFFFKGRVANLISYEAPVRYFVMQNGKPDLNLEIKTLLAIDAFFAISKRARYRKQIISELEKYGAKLRRDYFAPNPPQI